MKLGYFIGDSPFASEKGSVTSLPSLCIFALGFIAQNFGWCMQKYVCVFQSSGAYENVIVHNRISQFKACSFGGLGSATENSVLIVSCLQSAITYIRI